MPVYSSQKIYKLKLIKKNRKFLSNFKLGGRPLVGEGGRTPNQKNIN